jgi:riboflavin transporter FmnP
LRAKALVVIAVFTALTAVLNLIKIPAPYLPLYNYQLGDIILVISFFLFGIRIGFTIAVLNMIISIIMYSNLIGVIGAPYYLIAILTMILGAYLFLKIRKKKNLCRQYGDAKSVTLSTLFAVITRTLIMLPLDFFVYGFLVAFVSGWSVSDSFNLIMATMPGIILYNITVPIFVIPTSYYIAKRISKEFDSTLFKKAIL